MDRLVVTPDAVRGRLLAVLVLLLGFVVLLATVVTPAHADSLSDETKRKENEKALTEKELEELRHELEDTTEELADAVIQLKGLEKQLPAAQAALEKAQGVLDKALREAELLADKLQAARDTEKTIVDQIAEDSARTDESRAAVGKLARQAYKGELTETGLALILKAESATDLVEQYGMMTTALRSQTRILDDLAQADAKNRNSQVRLAAVGEKVADLKEEADAKAAEAEKARKEAAGRAAKITQLVADAKDKKDYIASKKAEQEAKEAELLQQRKTLENDLKKLIEKKRKQDAKKNKKKRKKSDGKIGSGVFANPTSTSPMYVTSSYGWRLHPVLGYYRLHAGIDLRAYCGTTIKAGRSGTVVWAKYRGGYGNQVMVDHGEIDGEYVMTSYNHLSSFSVGAGDTVTTGTKVGASGSTGTSAACHLHFEVYLNGKTVNPAPYL